MKPWKHLTKLTTKGIQLMTFIILGNLGKDSMMRSGLISRVIDMCIYRVVSMSNTWSKNYVATPSSFRNVAERPFFGVVLKKRWLFWTAPHILLDYATPLYTHMYVYVSRNQVPV